MARLPMSGLQLKQCSIRRYSGDQPLVGARGRNNHLSVIPKPLGPPTVCREPKERQEERVIRV